MGIDHYQKTKLIVKTINNATILELFACFLVYRLTLHQLPEISFRREITRTSMYHYKILTDNLCSLLSTCDGNTIKKMQLWSGLYGFSSRSCLKKFYQDLIPQHIRLHKIHSRSIHVFKSKAENIENKINP